MNAGEFARDLDLRARDLTTPTRWVHTMTIGPKDKSGWGLVAGSALALAVSNGPVVLSSFAVFMKPLTEGLMTDRGTLSLAPALGLILAGIVTPVVGMLTDRHGLRRIVFTSIVLTAIGLALLGAFVHSVPVFIALYCFIALAGAGYSPLPFAKAVSATFQTRRGLALGITMAGVGIGTALVPVLVQMMITAYGWRVAYIGLALIVLIVALPAIVLTLPNLRFDPAAAPPMLRAGVTAREALRSGIFWKLVAAFALVSLATVGVLAHVAALLSDRGISAVVASTAMSVGGVALLVGRLLSGYFLDKVFAPYVALASFVSALTGIVILVFSSIPEAGWIATGLVGFCIGAEVDLIAYLVCRYLGQRAFGAIYGYLFAAFTLGAGLGPLAMGQCFARTGSYDAALAAFIGGLLISCVLVTRLGAYRFHADGKPVEQIRRAEPLFKIHK